MITITLHGYRVPTLNAMFAMNHWGRRKEKQKVQAAFLSALPHTDGVSATLTGLWASTFSTALAMQASSRMIRRKKSTTRYFKSSARRVKKKQ